LDKPLAGLKAGLPREQYFAALEPEVEEAIEAAVAQLAALGVEMVDVELPLLEEVIGAHRAIIFSEASTFHQSRLAERADDYGDEIRPLLLAGLFLPAVEYLKAQRLRRRVRQVWAAEVFARVDFLLSPTTPVRATRFKQQMADLPGGEKPLVRAYLDLTLPFNYSGHPAISVPCGFSPAGLPIGMQLVGRPFLEGTILRAAHQYQQATEWHLRVPDVA
jgi:aspartyl-tRNA(Asn)/glutamyl-tRNA(Gln) amidotransferase subunit A